MSDDSIMTVDHHGVRIWHNRAGQIHRDGAPAIEHDNGRQEWWQKGRAHREDGPALIRANGRCEYWLEGEQLTEEEFRLKRGEILAGAFEASAQKPVTAAPRAVFKAKGKPQP